MISLDLTGGMIAAAAAGVAFALAAYALMAFLASFLTHVQELNR